jgi:hypothetical protein
MLSYPPLMIGSKGSGGGAASGNLWLSGVLKLGVATTGIINGATAGSTIGKDASLTGLTIDSANRTYTWAGTGTAGTLSAGLTETIAAVTTNSVAWVLNADTGPIKLGGALFFKNGAADIDVLAGYVLTDILTCTSSDGTVLTVGTSMQGFPLIRGTFTTTGPKTLTLGASVTGASTFDVLVVETVTPTLAQAKTKAAQIVADRGSRTAVVLGGTPPTISTNTGNSTVNGRTIAQGGLIATTSIPDGNAGPAGQTSQTFGFIYADTTVGTKALSTGMYKEWVFTGTVGSHFDIKVSSGGVPSTTIQVDFQYTEDYQNGANAVWYKASARPFTFPTVVCYIDVLFSTPPAGAGTRAIRAICSQGVNFFGMNIEASATIAATTSTRMKGGFWNDSYLFPQTPPDQTYGNPAHQLMDYFGSASCIAFGHKTNGWARKGGTIGVHAYVADRIVSNPWGIDEGTRFGFLDVMAGHMSINDVTLENFVSLGTATASPKFNNAGGSNSFENGLTTLANLVVLALQRMRYTQPNAWIVIDSGFYPPDTPTSSTVMGVYRTAFNTAFAGDYMAVLVDVSNGNYYWHNTVSATGDAFPLIPAGASGSTIYAPSASTVFLGGIVGTTMTVTGAPSFPLRTGMVFGVPPTYNGYRIISQTSGTTGGTGVYEFEAAPGDQAPGTSLTMYGDSAHLTQEGYAKLGQVPGKAVYDSAVLALAA